MLTDYITITEDTKLGTITVDIAGKEYEYSNDEYCISYDERRIRIMRITENICMPNEVELDMPYSCCIVHYLP